MKKPMIELEVICPHCEANNTGEYLNAPYSMYEERKALPRLLQCHYCQTKLAVSKSTAMNKDGRINATYYKTEVYKPETTDAQHKVHALNGQMLSSISELALRMSHFEAQGAQSSNTQEVKDFWVDYNLEFIRKMKDTDKIYLKEYATLILQSLDDKK